jgi:putative phage-type endonuclease
MPITAHQLEQRRNRLGSSDLAALLGLDPRRNAYDLWLQKTGKLEEPEAETGAMYAGTMFEEGVLKFAEAQLGKITRNQFRTAKDAGFPLGSNIDGLVVSTGEPVEAKTAGLYGPLSEPWGDFGTDQVPDRVIIQAQVHCIVTLKAVCHVPVFLGSKGFGRYTVPKDDAIADAILSEGYRFWNSHVLADLPPTTLTPNLSVIKRIRREPSKTVEIEQSLVEVWQTCAAAESAAKKEKEAALAAVLAALGDAEAGECPIGVFTYLEQKRAGYTVEPTSFRVPRFKKNK